MQGFAAPSYRMGWRGAGVLAAAWRAPCRTGLAAPSAGGRSGIRVGKTLRTIEPRVARRVRLAADVAGVVSGCEQIEC